MIDHYTIEKSTDSSYFNPMHEVVARGIVEGSASLDSAAYQDEDSYPTSPVNYYRLVTVMKDGSSIYSSVVRVDVNDKRTNPCSNPPSCTWTRTLPQRIISTTRTAPPDKLLAPRSWRHHRQLYGQQHRF